MVVVRTVLFAAMIALASATGAAAQNIAGVWRGEQSDPQIDHPDYLLVQFAESDGRVSGSGHINLCAACRGFDQHEVRWDGRLKAGSLELSGTYPTRPFEPSLRFTGQVSDDGARIDGVIHSGYRQEAFVLVREAADGAHEQRR